MTNAEKLYEEGMQALKRRDTAVALALFTELTELSRTPLNCSILGYCLALQKAEFKKGISLCKEAIKREPKGASHFLYLGRIHLLSGHKKDAVRIFRMGLRLGKNAELEAELERLGTRKNPVFPFLARENFINRFLGKTLVWFGLR
jgi:tetratricopeptide (TPR) repeat protein